MDGLWSDYNMLNPGGLTKKSTNCPFRVGREKSTASTNNQTAGEAFFFFLPQLSDESAAPPSNLTSELINNSTR